MVLTPQLETPPDEAPSGLPEGEPEAPPLGVPADAPEQEPGEQSLPGLPSEDDPPSTG